MHNPKVFKKDLTKREYYAAMAMAGDLASYGDGMISADLAVTLAESWVNCADALLRELEKTHDERMSEREMREQIHLQKQHDRMNRAMSEECINGLRQEEMG